MNRLPKSVCLFALIVSFSVSHAADLKQEQWINLMAQNMPALFCKSNQYYRDCYEVTQEECENTATFAVEACVANYIQELPDIFSYEESRKWGALIEKCVDEEYSQTLSGQIKDTPECQEIK